MPISRVLPVVRVFVSSTWVDLQPERQAAASALHRIRETKFVGMEYFGSRDESTKKASLQEVDNSHAYIGIFGDRYGSGITEDEYCRARDRRLPCFIYFKADSSSGNEGPEPSSETGTRLAALKSELRGSERHTVTEYTTPDDLAAKITADLHRWLSDAYLTPQVEKVAKGGLPFIATFRTLIEEKTAGFVGRDFVFSAIDRWLNNPAFPSGYVEIVGEPGIGKTSLLARLVRQRECVHHFNSAAQNIRSHREFLRNVCAQLIVHYQLKHDSLRSDASENSAFLSQLLAEAAAVLRPNESLVIAVDALDEVEDRGLDPRSNLLYLPEVLPPNVYFVVTTRPRADRDYRLKVDRIESIYIDESDESNLSDIRLYVREFIRTHHEGMNPRLAEWAIAPEEFIDILVSKSEGNFLYLNYVLRDIESKRMTASTIGDVPQGLKRYYQAYWGAMEKRAGDRFERMYKPVVCYLATVREPVTIPQLRDWTHLSRDEISDVVDVWREFLNVAPGPRNETAYRVYHGSFRDFLKEDVGLKPAAHRISELAIRKIAAVLGIAW